jgi:hypothetical protein
MNVFIYINYLEFLCEPLLFKEKDLAPPSPAIYG